ncbi:UNVERIFIED_CONTAM: hypothetical protein Sradi_4910200 [Sesamum radiatum]|uniref:Uncharacterized protein n=1 Tax=Sesamum radiatum TaxID=300843 RepID=A0AAW2MCJ8_SESRA
MEKEFTMVNAVRFGTNHAFMCEPENIGRLLTPLWLSRTTQGASHLRSKLLQQAAGAVWSQGFLASRRRAASI